MTHSAPDFDQLVEVTAEYLRSQLTDHDGHLGGMTISKFRIAAAYRWLKEDPSKVLEIAAKSKKAAKDMLEAAANFLTSSSSFSAEALEVIAYLLTNYDTYSKNTADETRFESNPLKIHVILALLTLRETYGVNPLRKSATRGSEKTCGCDIVAAAILQLGFARPRSFEGVRRIWVDRNRYFQNFIPRTYTDEKLDELLFGCHEDFVEIFALADAKTSRAVRVRTKPE
jgi:hypothetical protein